MGGSRSEGPQHPSLGVSLGSAMAHRDLDTLLKEMLLFARTMLAKQGAVLPFGASMGIDGKVTMAQGYTGYGTSAPQRVVNVILDGFRRAARDHEVRAVAVCYDAVITDPVTGQRSDAILTLLEHENGEALAVYLPYRHVRGRGFVCDDDLIAMKGQVTVFPPGRAE